MKGEVLEENTPYIEMGEIEEKERRGNLESAFSSFEGKRDLATKCFYHDTISSRGLSNMEQGREQKFSEDQSPERPEPPAIILMHGSSVTPLLSSQESGWGLMIKPPWGHKRPGLVQRFPSGFLSWIRP